MVKINEYGEIIRDHIFQEQENPKWEEYQRLEYEIFNNHHNPTKDPVKIARYKELRKMLNIKKNEDALKKAKEEIKRKIIDSEKTNDNTIPFAAMAIFKDKNE